MAAAPAAVETRPRVQRQRMTAKLPVDDGAPFASPDSTSGAQAADFLSNHSNKRKRGNLGRSAGEIRVNELRYQAFVPPVFIPPSDSQCAADSVKLESAQRVQYLCTLFDDCSSAVNAFSEVPRLFADLKTPEALSELRNRTKASEAVRAEAASYRPGTRIARGGRAGQELRELARAQQKATLAEQLDTLADAEISAYMSQLFNEPGNDDLFPIKGFTSGSHEFSILQRASRSYETPFARLDALNMDQRVYSTVRTEMQKVLKEINSVLPAEAPAVTENDGWRHRGLVRYLVQRSISQAMKPEETVDPQLVCEAGEVHRKDASIEAQRWVSVVRAANEVDRKEAEEKFGFPPTSPVKSRKRKRPSPPTTTIPIPESAPETEAKSAATLTAITSSNQSGILLDQLTRAAAGLQQQADQVKNWYADVQAAYDERAELKVAEGLLDQGLVLLEHCDISEHLTWLEKDVTNCRATGEKLRFAVAPLFMRPIRHNALKIHDVLVWVPICEALPFEIPESFAITREIKLALTWREMTTAAVGERDLHRCLDLVNAESNSSLELPGLEDLKIHVNTAQWVQKVEKYYLSKKPYNQAVVEDLLQNIPGVPNLTDRESVTDLLERREAAGIWIAKALSPKFRRVIGNQEALALERVFSHWGRIIPDEVYKLIAGGRSQPEWPQLQPVEKKIKGSTPPACCTPEEFDQLCVEYAAIRINFPSLRSLDATRQRLLRWLRRVQRTLTAVAASPLSELQNLLKEGAVLAEYLDLSAQLKELKSMVSEFQGWLKEAQEILKCYRRAVADGDALRAGSDLFLQVEVATNQSLEASEEGKQEEADETTDVAALQRASIAVVRTITGFERPRLEDVESLLARLAESSVTDEAICRQLQLIADKGRKWKQRVLDLLAGQEKISVVQFARAQLQLIMEARILCVDAEAENNLIANFGHFANEPAEEQEHVKITPEDKAEIMEPVVAQEVVALPPAH